MGDSVDRSLQRFVGVTLDHSLDETAPPPQRLLHAHAQVVVGFLRRQILQSEHLKPLKPEGQNLAVHKLLNQGAD